MSGLGFEAMGAVVGPFLLEQGLLQNQVGWALTGNIIFMLGGSLWGGFVSDKFSSVRTFIFSGCLLAISISLLGLLSGPLSPVPLVVLLFSCYFLTGVFISASYSFYMAQAKGELESTRFTFLMAMTNLCESVAAFSIGKILYYFVNSYAFAFFAMSLLSLIGIFFLWQAFSEEKTQ